MRYSLRNLLLAVLAVAIVLAIGMPVWKMLSYNPVALAVSQLESEGGKVFKLVDNGVWRGVYACVDFSGMNLHDVDLSQIRVVSPDVINFRGSTLSDEDLPSLYGVNTAQIIVAETNVTDAGIDMLRKTLRHNVEIVRLNQ